MKGLRSTLLLLVVLVGLGGYIYFTGAKPTEETEKIERVFPDLDTATIEEMTVKSQSGDVTTLKKANGIWALTSPISIAASTTDVDSVANVLATMDIARVVEENPADLADYGLDKPQIEVEFKAEGGKTSGKVSVGLTTATGGNLYIRRNDERRVLLTGQYNETGLNKSTFDLQDKQIAKIDRAKVTGVELLVGTRAAEFAKSGEDWKMVKPQATRADNSTLEALLGRIESAQMKSVAVPAPTRAELRRFGFEKPKARVVLRGETSTTVEVGAEADESSTFLRELSKPDIYTVATTTTDDLIKAPDEYRRKELFDMRAFNATRVEFTRGSQTVVIERVKATDENSPDTWRRVSPNPGDPDRTKVEGLLAGLADVRATAFLTSRARTGVDAPVLTVVAKFDEGKREERVTFGRNGDAAFAARPDEPGAAAIDSQKLVDALETLDEIAK